MKHEMIAIDDSHQSSIENLILSARERQRVHSQAIALEIGQMIKNDLEFIVTNHQSGDSQANGHSNIIEEVEIVRMIDEASNHLEEEILQLEDLKDLEEFVMPETNRELSFWQKLMKFIKGGN